jgi:transcriptional repressor NrdR
MVCVHCGSETRVSNSRLQKRSNQVWRRRQCLSCQAVFTSLEGADYSSVWRVQGKAGALEPFSRDRLFMSLYRACEHRKTVLADAGGLADTITSKLAGRSNNSHITAKTIAQTAMVALNRFDKTAGAVYQAFHPYR